MKPTILLETDVFYEDEIIDTKQAISRYFNIEEINFQELWSKNRGYPSEHAPRYYRGSLNNAKFVGFKFEYANAMKWIPEFRKFLLYPECTTFVELGFIHNYIEDFSNTFFRPCHGFKEFSGQVFPTKEKFEIEYNFLKQNKNTSDDLMCVMSPAASLKNEYRCVFVNRKYVSGSQYMHLGQKKMGKFAYVPQSVIDFATHKIAFSSYFQNIPNFVIDIGTVGVGQDNHLTEEHFVTDHHFLIEINAFETASFYDSDIFKIYEKYAQT